MFYSYFSDAFRKKHLKKLRKFLKSYIKKNRIDAIALTGTSGKVLGSLLAWWFPDLIFFICRKPSESSHSDAIVEVEGNKDHGALKSKGEIRWMLLDDLVDSGSTVNRVFKQIADELGFLKTIFVGVVTYQDDDQDDGIGEQNDHSVVKSLIKRA